MSAGTLKDVMDRLYSIDANERVKAANEIGEIGTEKEAPIVLKVAHEDETSTVRQMAIQSYFEILKEKAYEDILKAAKSHFDQYVRIYAISILGKLDQNQVSEPLLELMKDEDPKIRATVVKSMIHANTIQNAKHLETFFENETHMLTQCNIIEAWAIWNYKQAKGKINKLFENTDKMESQIELKTISLFTLALFGDKKALKELKEGNIDTYYRIKVDSKHFTGRKGLVKALELLKN
ncbi:MAG: hypothetical protein HeimC2_03880 [Candidatus Heimdallarchaeota archaeon LC_2]|nr:MAG: hypothetical protein HeimC2_03880 [Candidatus Heimdallarchaeota archaeon LC_2]